MSSAYRTSWLTLILTVNLIAAAALVLLVHLANLQQRAFFLMLALWTSVPIGFGSFTTKKQNRRQLLPEVREEVEGEEQQASADAGDAGVLLLRWCFRKVSKVMTINRCDYGKQPPCPQRHQAEKKK